MTPQTPGRDWIRGFDVEDFDAHVKSTVLQRSLLISAVRYLGEQHGVR